MASITVTHIIEYLFCPRFIYFEHVLHIPEYQERHFKVQKGREVHEQKTAQNAEYLRRRIGMQDKHLNQYLTNEWIRGEVDEILELKDGTFAPLDYKFAEYKDRVFDTYKTQLYCYAWLISQHFGQPVQKGFLVYTRSKNKLVEVPIEKKHIDKVKKDATAIHQIIRENTYPKATKYKKRCLTCTYRNICTR